MEYKIGDEVLIKAVITGSREDESKLLVRTTRNSFLVEKNDVMHAQDMTAEEAWNISKKLFVDYSDRELDEIFGKGWSYPNLMKLTPRQAKSKIKAWEEKIGIKVGDVIFTAYNQSINGVVTNIYGKCNKNLYVLWDDGSSGVLEYTKSIKKTGRHIDIDGLLRNIGGIDA